MRQGGFPFYYLFFFLLIFLTRTISEYPCFTLSIDDKKMRGARLLGGWSREEIFLSEINQDKVLQKNLVGFLVSQFFILPKEKRY